GDAAPDRVWRPIYDPSSRPSGLHATTMLVPPNDSNRLFVAGISPTPGGNELLMLTPANPADPQAAPWQASLLFTGFQGSGSLVADPSAPDRFYLVGRSTIYRFASTDGWQTWSRTTVADQRDLFHVYDLVEENGSSGHRIVAATTTALWVTDELGLGWSTGDVFAMHAPSRLAIAPGDPDRGVAKRTRALTIGESGVRQRA